MRYGRICQPETAPIGRVVHAEEDIRILQAKLEAMKKAKKLTPAQIREGIDLLFQKHDYSPVESLIMTRLSSGDEQLCTRIDMFLTEFLVPKLKSVEVSGSVDHNHTVVIRRYGSDGKAQDEPLKVPGLPAAESPVRQASRGVELTIDAEVSRG